MIVAALYIPSWIFLIAGVLFVVGAFSDSIPSLLLALGIIAVFVACGLVQIAGNGLHDVFGWPSDHLIEAHPFNDPQSEPNIQRQNPFYEREEKSEIEYR